MARTIAVTGKGGVGKTTVAAMMIRCLTESAEGAVLALDADPDSNLASLLGMTVEATVGSLREDALKAVKDLPPGMSKQTYIEMGLHQLIVETPKVDLIAMGHGEGPGCYCFINHVLRGFADGLASSYEWIVVDNEAGLEHLNRRTAANIDDLIVVVNASPLAVDCAGRIDRVVAELRQEVRRKYYLLNAVRDDRAETVREKMSQLDLEYLGAVPPDDALDELLFRGESIYALENSPALSAIRDVMQTIGAQPWKSPT